MKKESKKTIEKYVTMSGFEKAMVSIAHSFDKINEKLSNHDKAFTLILKQMQTFTEEAREHRQTMSSLMRSDITQERIVDDLKIRVERLEMQIK
jgi:hypothetical protein